MSLAQQQAFVARLCTDADLVARCATELEVVAKEFGLAPEVVRAFWEQEQARVRLFRATLQRKRWKQFAAIVRHAVALAPEAMEAAFEQFVAGQALRAPEVYTRDVADFLEAPGIELPPHIRAVAQFEYDREEVWRRGKGWQLRRYSFPVLQLLHSSESTTFSPRRTWYLLRYRQGRVNVRRIWPW